MPATRYKIWQVGPAVGQGVSGSIFVGISAVAKTFTQQNPYVVANELICCNLGRAVLLPVPPNAIVEHGGQLYSVSLDFNLAGEDLPPVNADSIIAAQAQLALGIVLFDVWIANGDRHRKNIAHDKTTGRVQIFDHSHALFGSSEGRDRFSRLKRELGIERHCLAQEIVSLDGMDEWQKKFLEIPEFFIRGVIESAESVNLQKEDIEAAIGFLLDRRANLINLLKANRSCLPKVKEDLWANLAEQPVAKSGSDIQEKAGGEQ